MKKTIALITLIICCFSLAACQGQQGEKENLGESAVTAYDCIEGFDFYPFPDGTLGVHMARTSFLEEIVIPAEYNGKAVTRILSKTIGSSQPAVSIIIPASITSIAGSAFDYFESLENIIFLGTIEQWNAIIKGDRWNKNIPATEVICSDGTVPLK